MAKYGQICKKAQNWNGLAGHVYGSINLKFFGGAPKTCNCPPMNRAEIQIFFGPGYYPLKVLLCSYLRYLCLFLVFLCLYLVYFCLYVTVFMWSMRAYLCDAWATDTPFVYSGNTKSGDEMLPTVDYLDISAFNLTILRRGVVTMCMMTQGRMIFRDPPQTN